jgi:hypothetical protein
MQTFAHDLLSALRGARTFLIAEGSPQLPALEDVIGALEPVIEGDDLGAAQAAAVAAVKDFLGKAQGRARQFTPPPAAAPAAPAAPAGE